jgi:hypothetical protein
MQHQHREAASLPRPAPTLRLLLDNMAFDVVTGAQRRQLEEWGSFEGVARLADG